MSFRNQRRQRKQFAVSRVSRAFTLIELLVALFIVAIITGAAIMSLGIVGGDRNLQTEARRLTTLIELANDEAAILGRELGLELIVSGYRFVEFDPLLNRWYEVIGDDVLRPRKIDASLEFDLFMENRRVLLDIEMQNIGPDPNDKKDQDDEENADYSKRNDDRRNRDSKLGNNYLPHILIMSSGDVSPFELTISRPVDRTSLTLVMSQAGKLEIQRDDDIAP